MIPLKIERSLNLCDRLFQISFLSNFQQRICSISTGILYESCGVSNKTAIRDVMNGWRSRQRKTISTSLLESPNFIAGLSSGGAALSAGSQLGENTLTEKGNLIEGLMVRAECVCVRSTYPWNVRQRVFECVPVEVSLLGWVLHVDHI